MNTRIHAAFPVAPTRLTLTQRFANLLLAAVADPPARRCRLRAAIRLCRHNSVWRTLHKLDVDDLPAGVISSITRRRKRDLVTGGIDFSRIISAAINRSGWSVIISGGNMGPSGRRAMTASTSASRFGFVQGRNGEKASKNRAPGSGSCFSISCGSIRSIY